MKNLFWPILCIFIFSSCSNDDEVINSNSLNTDLNRVLKTIEFSYRGETYSSKYYKEGDSILILDYKTQKVYKELQKNENKLVVIDMIKLLISTVSQNT